MHFADRLFQSISKKGTPLCVGFDPHLEQLPPDIVAQCRRRNSGSWHSAAADAIQEFLLTILDRIQNHVAVIKPQFAFFEQFGPDGMRVLQRICKDARNAGLIVIGDAKRSDIGSTAQAYARAYLEDPEESNIENSPAIPLDALTINPYLGWEGIKPFLEMKTSTGVFVLVKTSNASGAQIQDLETPSGTVAEVVARLVSQWGKTRLGVSGYSDVGAVVGAPFPDQAKSLRQLMPETPFLIPGYGFQGGSARDAVASFDSKGMGGVINSSRGILYAYRNKPYTSRFDAAKYALAAEAACLETIEDIRQSLI